MGIADNLRVFMSAESELFDPAKVPESRSEVASSWTGAIAPEIPKLFAPMAVAFLIPPTVPFLLTPADFALRKFPDALNAAMDKVASSVVDAGGQQKAPSKSLDSENKIFDKPVGTYTIDEICQRCEDRIIEWLMTGTFSAFFVAGVSPGVPGTPWVLPAGAAMPEPPDTDKDGYTDIEEDEAGTDPEDKDDYPKS